MNSSRLTPGTLFCTLNKEHCCLDGIGVQGVFGEESANLLRFCFFYLLLFNTEQVVVGEENTRVACRFMALLDSRRR